VCRFLLPTRLQWVEPAGGELKSANVEQKTVTLIYPYPNMKVVAKDKKSQYGSYLVISRLKKDRKKTHKNFCQTVKSECVYQYKV
jgi:hypothetical protein